MWHPVSALENKARLDANKAPGVQESFQRRDLKDGMFVKILVVTQKRSQFNPGTEVSNETQRSFSEKGFSFIWCFF